MLFGNSPFVAPQEYPVPVLKSHPGAAVFSLILPASAVFNPQLVQCLYYMNRHLIGSEYPHIGGVCPQQFRIHREIQSLPPGKHGF